jgi:hypothetical protein
LGAHNGDIPGEFRLTLHRRSPLAGFGVLFAIAASGCGGPSTTPAPSLLTDPQAVVSRSLAGFEGAATFHFLGPIGGSVDPNAASALLGGGSTGISGKLKLDGASVVGDVDVAHAAFHVTMSLPSLFDSSAEAIVVNGYAYTKVSTPLSPTAVLYARSKVDGSQLMPGTGPRATFGAAPIIGELVSALATSGATATLAGQETIDARAAYHIIETVPADALRRTMESAGLQPAGVATLALAPVDYWVYDDSLQPAAVKVSLSSPTLGSLVVALVLTNYDLPVIINPPAEGQVAPG